jgi:hypothetical protein
MNENIFSQIRLENEDFFNGSISVNGYDFNQYTTIRKCALYNDSKFEDDSLYLGRKKQFFNVVNPPCEVATKMLNVDTKNIKLWATNPKSYWSTYLLEKELKQWLKMSDFAATLNKLAEELPIYGSVVLEKTKKGAEVVDIRRVMLDPSVDSIKDSRFITTIHYMTPSELRATSWNNVEEAIERFGSTNAAEPYEDKSGGTNQQTSTPYIKIYKRYGEVPEYWISGKSDKMVKAVFIVAGADSLLKNAEGKEIGEAGLIMFSARWNKPEYPFKDFHYTRVKGRWLGRGIVEMLFSTQARINELKNQKRISMEISAMHLFTTPDKQIVRNVLSDLESGDLIISPGGINPIATEERNLAAFDSEEQSYLQQADKLTFAYDAVRGENPTASTPLGTTQIVTAQASSTFGFKRENICIAYREFFNELVMPQLLSDLTAEHVMRFTGSTQELQKLDMMAAELHSNNFIKSKVLNGEFPTQEEVEAEKQKSIREYRKLGTSRFLAMKKAFYGDVEYEFDYVIDNENYDVQSIAANLKSVISDIASNPAILQDPRLKLMYFKFAERIGINQAELEAADDQAQEMQQSMQGQQQLQQALQGNFEAPQQPVMQ